MKKGILILLLIGFLALPVIGLAELYPTPGIGLMDGIDIVFRIVFTLLMATAAIFILLGAIDFLTAGGDTEKVATGRQKILYAVVAVIVAILAQGVIAFIRAAFPAV